MAGLFSRLKIWNSSETLVNTDLNAEFNNIIANMDSTHAEGYSQNLAQMQMTEDPGGVGSEHLTQPISTAQEIERLRFVIERITGGTEWYQSPPTNLTTLQNNLSQAFAISPDRIISGKKSVNSSQPIYLEAQGAGGIAIIASPTTPFSAYIDNTLITLTSNVVLSGLSAPPTSGNTATLLDSFASNQFSKSVQRFNLNAPGSEIVSRLNKFSAFKIVNGGNTEYFVGTVVSGSYTTYTVVSGTTTPTVTPVTQIVGIQRGSLFDSTQVPSTPIALTTGHTITVLRLTSVFLTSGGTLDVTYNPLSYQGTAPSGASIGDYWFDTVNSTWKRYNGSLWVVAGAIFIGICAQDGVNTVFARSVDFYNQFSNLTEVMPETATNTVVTTPYVAGTTSVSVYGKNITKKYTPFSWDITSQLVSGETESASTMYYLYVKEAGDTVISALKPLLDNQRVGYYHPYETWRAVGSVFNDASSNFDPATVETFSASYGTLPPGLGVWDVWPAETVGELKSHVGPSQPKNHVIANGTSYSINQLPRLFIIEGVSGGTASSGFFNVADLRGGFVRGLNASSGRDPNAATRTALNTGGNIGDSWGAYEADAFQDHTHSVQQKATTVQATDVGTIANGGAGIVTSANTGSAQTGNVSSETRPKNIQFNYIIRF